MQGGGQDHVNEVIGQAHSHLQRWRTWRSQPGQYATSCCFPDIPSLSFLCLPLSSGFRNCIVQWARLAGFAGKVYADTKVGLHGWPGGTGLNSREENGPLSHSPGRRTGVRLYVVAGSASTQEAECLFQDTHFAKAPTASIEIVGL